MAKSDSTPSDQEAQAEAPKRVAQAKTAPAAQNKQAQPEDTAPKVSLDSYLRLCGSRPDQMAGFAAFARRTVKGKLSMSAWGEAFAQFCSNPVQ